MAKANLKQLNELHRIITEYYMEAVGSGEELSSGTLAAINAHLKFNDISVDIVESSPGQDLTSKLQLLMLDQKEA